MTSEGTQVLVVHIAGSLWISANSRHHWRRKAEKTATLRGSTMFQARNNLTPMGSVSRIVATIHYPTNAKADPPNASPTLKALLDGIVDAGILDDDDSEHVPEVAFRRGPKTGMQGIYCIDVELIP